MDLKYRLSRLCAGYDAKSDPSLKLAEYLVVLLFSLWPLDIHQTQDHQKYELFSASWKSDGRRFEQIGRYKIQAQYWELWNDVFPNEKYHFNGRHIRIITNFVSLINL